MNHPHPDDRFYSELPVWRQRLGELLRSKTAYRQVPETWQVVITDITGSTRAVDAGKQEDVNLVAAGSIVLVLNIALKRQLDIPFFFGGDGATFILPVSMLAEVQGALKTYQETVASDYQLQLRVGTVPVAAIYRAGEELRLSKFCGAGKLVIPVVLGNGIRYAENLVKGEHPENSNLAEQPAEADLTGVQCRWDHIAAPEGKEEIVTLLVTACVDGQQGEIFSEVIQVIEQTYGSAEKRQPLSTDRLRFKSSLAGLAKEMRFRLGKLPIIELVLGWLKSLYGHIWFRTNAGQAYLERLIERADTLVLDGRINTIMSGTSKQRTDLVAQLDELEAAGRIKYGLHTGQASVMTCYVRDLENDHIHFIDGEHGGYTQASKALKQKLR